MLSLSEQYPVVSQETGYNIFKNYYNEVNLEEYYDLICREIERGNVVEVDALVRFLDVSGTFPDYERMFQHVAVHGTISMYIFVFYMFSFWNEEQEIPTFRESIGILNENCIDVKEKRKFLSDIFEKYGSLSYYKENIDEDPKYDDEREHNLFYDFLTLSLLVYGVDVREINKSFWKNCEAKHTELSP
jgi:hypothetical protein